MLLENIFGHIFRFPWQYKYRYLLLISTLLLRCNRYFYQSLNLKVTVKLIKSRCKNVKLNYRITFLMLFFFYSWNMWPNFKILWFSKSRLSFLLPLLILQKKMGCIWDDKEENNNNKFKYIKWLNNIKIKLRDNLF